MIGASVAAVAGAMLAGQAVGGRSASLAAGGVAAAWSPSRGRAGVPLV